MSKTFDIAQSLNISDIAQSLNINLDEYNQLVLSQNDLINSIYINELYMSTALDMTIPEYRTHVLKETEFNVNCKNDVIVENKHIVETAYTLEKFYINFNAGKLNKFLNLGNVITPIGKNSAQIIEYYLYSGIPRITRDVVKEIINYFKIIDVDDVHQKYNDKLK
jgi:hypothetical protein